MNPQDHPDAVLWSGRPSWAEYIFLWFFALTALIRAVPALWLGDWTGLLIYTAGGGALSALAVFLRQNTHYALSREAVLRRRGVFLGRDPKYIPIKNIASVSIQQGPLDRIFGIGAVVLYMKEGECRSERLAGVKDPNRVCRKIAALL